MKLKPIEELTFTDDFMFGHVMQNAEICKGFLERMLEIKIERIEYPELQKSISPHYQSKGIRLDVYVQDSNRVFDIEIQNSLDENLPKRTRYYQSMMDIDLLLKGKNYTELKESFVIFICKDDFFGISRKKKWHKIIIKNDFFMGLFRTIWGNLGQFFYLRLPFFTHFLGYFR